MHEPDFANMKQLHLNAKVFYLLMKYTDKAFAVFIADVYITDDALFLFCRVFLPFQDDYDSYFESDPWDNTTGKSRIDT